VDRLFLKDVEAWSAVDLDDLVAAKIPEGMRVEYKGGLKIDTKSQRAEAAKDVSGFANAQGGWLFYGIAEDDSEEPLPTAVAPLTAEGLQTRLENILDSSLEPRVDFHAAPVKVDGGIVLVIRVEARTGNPIMVQGYGEYRYYRRSGTRTRQMTASEVTDAYANARDREKELAGVLNSLPLKARITRARSIDELRLAAYEQEQPENWLPLATVVVAAIDCPRPLIGPKKILRDAFREPSEGMRGGPRRSVRPGGRWVIDAFGLHDEKTFDLDGNIALAYRIAVFRQGVFEWARRYRTEPTIPGKTLTEDVHDALRYAGSIFAEVDYFGRLETHIRIENAEQAIPEIPASWDLSVHPAGVEWVGNCREVSVDELQLDPTPTVRAAMDVIWQGFGVEKCPYFDREGAWSV
jgi:Schlafen, AlbA_2